MLIYKTATSRQYNITITCGPHLSSLLLRKNKDRDIAAHQPLAIDC